MGTLICINEGRKLDESEFLTNLTMALRLENLGFFIGAGASIGAGGKTMGDIWSEFTTNHSECLDTLQNYKLLTTNKDGSDTSPNVEELLSDIYLLLKVFDKTKCECESESEYQKLQAVCEQLEKCITDAASLSYEPKKLQSHIQLLQKLISTRQPGQPSPWIFTTNYDLAIERAAEYTNILVNNGFIGIQQRTFSPQAFDLGYRNVNAKGEARFGCNDIYLDKLHGSLSWYESDNEIFETQILTNPNNKPVMIYPNKAKYIDTIGFLYGELFRRFADFLAKPQTCLLISGYSFGDNHINRLIRSALLNPTFQLIIFTTQIKNDFNDLNEELLLKLPIELQKLINLKSPRITVVGSTDRLTFDKTVQLIPESHLFNKESLELRENIKRLYLNKASESEEIQNEPY